jgi:hypothetical protein
MVSTAWMGCWTETGSTLHAGESWRQDLLSTAMVPDVARYLPMELTPVSLTDPTQLYHCSSFDNQHSFTFDRHKNVVNSITDFLTETIEGAIITKE